MIIQMHTLTDKDGWQMKKQGDFAELMWSDWERSWICEMLETGSSYLHIGDTMFNVGDMK